MELQAVLNGEEEREGEKSEFERDWGFWFIFQFYNDGYIIESLLFVPILIINDGSVYHRSYFWLKIQKIYKNVIVLFATKVFF